MAISASRLRQDIYRLLDLVLEEGTPLEIEHNGHILRIVPDTPVAKLDRLGLHPDVLTGDPEDLVDLDWSRKWTPCP